MKKNDKIIPIKKFRNIKIFRGKIRKREVVIFIIILMVISLFISGYSMGKGISETKINSETRYCKTYFRS